MRKISEGFMKVKLPGEQEIDKESMDIFEEFLTGFTGRYPRPGDPFRSDRRSGKLHLLPV